MTKKNLKLSKQQIIVLARNVTFVQGELLNGFSEGKVRKGFLRKTLEAVSLLKEAFLR